MFSGVFPPRCGKRLGGGSSLCRLLSTACCTCMRDSHGPRRRRSELWSGSLWTTRLRNCSSSLASQVLTAVTRSSSKFECVVQDLMKGFTLPTIRFPFFFFGSWFCKFQNKRLKYRKICSFLKCVNIDSAIPTFLVWFCHILLNQFSSFASFLVNIKDYFL